MQLNEKPILTYTKKTADNASGENDASSGEIFGKESLFSSLDGSK